MYYEETDGAVCLPPVVHRLCNLFVISMGNKVGDGLAVSNFVCLDREVWFDLNYSIRGATGTARSG